MNPKPKKFEVTLPDGKIARRESVRHVYVAAVIGHCQTYGKPGEWHWGVIGWCGRQDLADKLASRWRKIGPGLKYPVKQVLIVEVQEVEKWTKVATE